MKRKEKSGKLYTLEYFVPRTPRLFSSFYLIYLAYYNNIYIYIYMTLQKHNYILDGINHSIRCDNTSTMLLDKKGEPLINQKRMTKMNQLFKSFIRFAKMNDIKWICQGGTLLGAARDSKGFLYWDDDVDVIVFYKQSYDLLYSLINKETKDGYILEIADVGFIYHKKGCCDLWVDVWVYDQKPNDDRYRIAGPFVKKRATFILEFFWPKEYVYEDEMKNAIYSQFESYHARIPPNWKAVVERHFGNNALTHYIYNQASAHGHALAMENQFWEIITIERRQQIIDLLCSAPTTDIYNVKSVCQHKLNYMYTYGTWFTVFHGNYDKLNELVAHTINTDPLLNYTPEIIKKQISHPLIFSCSKDFGTLVDILTL
jgi:hypothetical protein